ncbi:MAG: acyclic terpene utilization AtuA family protein, partial [Gammaproteobacteria bacterium]
MSTRVLVPSGVLGLGFEAEALARGIAARPDVICIDGGSTDSGPFYLGTGTSKYARASTVAEWRELMRARAEAGVPLVIGSCGTCGTDASVEWMLDITRELAHERGERLKVATLYSSQSTGVVQAALARGAVTPLTPAPDICAQRLASCTNIVALAGAEQLGAALRTGADIVLAGRATDTAGVCALPLLRGEHDGAAWHGAKVVECGALCSTHPTSGVVMVDIDRGGFTVEALGG